MGDRNSDACSDARFLPNAGKKERKCSIEYIRSSLFFFFFVSRAEKATRCRCDPQAQRQLSEVIRRGLHVPDALQVRAQGREGVVRDSPASQQLHRPERHSGPNWSWLGWSSPLLSPLETRMRRSCWSTYDSRVRGRNRHSQYANHFLFFSALGARYREVVRQPSEARAMALFSRHEDKTTPPDQGHRFIFVGGRRRRASFEAGNLQRP